ncbi:MAG: metallophosphoesterase [Deltaproteobacteria bacterium]|nr:metallophosphoesterase [Deltaproteobacteria bacterium]MDQ3298565.1 metallophosphoesterase family protein [Myxococcota bacterium]
MQRGTPFGWLAVLCTLAIGMGVARAEPKMLKGPYLQDLAPTSITVMWQLESAAEARLVVTGPGGERVYQVEAARLSEAAVTGLTPSSRYRYRVEIAGHAWDGEFATAPPIGKDVPFSFAVLGDTRDGIEPHRRVTQRIAQDVPDFILGTGDMVDDGSRQDQWQEFFDIENPLLRNNVYFPAVGNHDRQGRGRTADTYRAYFSVPENGNDTERYYAFTYATSRILVLDSNVYSFALTDQTAWIERELIAARQDPDIRHIFVVMHHPPFSISLHGGNRELRDRWAPLFTLYQVSAVFSGHDHVYTRAERDGVRYFVSGGGGAPLYPKRPRDPVDIAAVKKFERVFHYLRVNVTGPTIEISGIRADGTTIETTTWSEGPQMEPETPPELAAAGATTTMSAAPPRPGQVAKRDSSTMWIAFGGVGLLLAAAVVVLTLKR